MATRGRKPLPTALKELEGDRGKGRRPHIEFRVDKDGNLAFILGKASFDVDQLVENYYAVQDEVLRLKPASAKGRYVIKGSVSTTMGPGIPLDTSKTRITDEK